MGYTSQNPQYNPLISSIVNQRNWATGLAKLGRGYARPLAIIDAMNPSGSFSVESPDGSMRVAFQPRQEVTQIIASVTQSGANLIITFNDPTYTGFRTKSIVADNIGYQGYVVATSAGTVTISPATYPTALVAATHFVAGRSITDFGNAAGNQNSTGMTNLYMTNDYRTNYSAIMRDSLQVSSRDKFVSYKWNEEYYGFMTTEMEMMDRYAKYKVWKLIYSEGGQFNGLEGVTNQFYGMKASIREQGGRYVPMSSPFAQSDLESDLIWMAQANPDQYQTFLWVGGRQAWTRVSSFYANDITFTVSKAVINGQDLNFDIHMATIAGVSIKFMVWGVFDDYVKFPIVSSFGGLQESYTYFILNTAPIPAVGGGVVPVVRKFHFAHSQVTGGAETLYRYIPGMVGPGMSSSTGGPVMNGYQMTASPVMGGQFEIAEDGGFDFQGDACVCRFLVA